jgi:hypothetical protein
MRLKSLSVAGFRGFNSPCSLEFHRLLTLISAPNSHGKTSITEAFEFLFYGQTSKVESADSKEEYKDSYRNRHYPADAIPYIEAECVDNASVDWLFRVEMHEQGVRRFANGTEVEEWPFQAELANTAPPFVVQHALKKLLLAAPSERFQGFARLLGLKDVDTVQQALINLCTKPETHLRHEAKRLLTEFEVFLGRLKSNGTKDATTVAKALSKGVPGLEEAFEKLHKWGEKLAKKLVRPEELSSTLVALRNAAAAKVYSGSVQIGELSTPDQQELSTVHNRIEKAIGGDIVEIYGRLELSETADRLRKELQLLSIGIELISRSPETCPLCEQTIDEGRRSTIHNKHQELANSFGTGPDLSTIRPQLAFRLKQLTTDVETHCQTQLRRSTDLINANTPEASQKIRALFGKGHEHELFLVAAAGAAIRPKHAALREAAANVSTSTQVCTDAIHSKSEAIQQIEMLVMAVAGYLEANNAYNASLQDVRPTLEEPSHLLRQAVDAQAGTTELSLLIEVLDSQASIRKAVRIRDVLANLKELRKHVDQAVGQTMEDAFSSELTGAVMDWYQRIQTTGDPDVHFSGFTMERTKAGDFKNRRVRVAARSYGVELASAVSSLSESKLNALGLCMSIATTLRAPGPWEFLLLDDPIQSWDDDHEVQFIEILRRLAEDEGRQIILMSHRNSWVDSVAAGCRTLNGLRYNIASYCQDGPKIVEMRWASVEQRLKEVLTIANDTSASPVRLQQAEEELRIATCQLAAEAAKAKLNRTVGSHSLNSDKVRSILSEAGCPTNLLDRVVATFTTTDDAHHAPKDYQPNRERIRRYHGALSELKTWVTKAKS